MSEGFLAHTWKTTHSFLSGSLVCFDLQLQFVNQILETHHILAIFLSLQVRSTSSVEIFSQLLRLNRIRHVESCFWPDLSDGINLNGDEMDSVSRGVHFY